MYLHDISGDVFNSPKYKGDPDPKYEWLTKIEYGEECSVSYIEMCTHTSTHIDAPAHYIKGGATVDEIPLSKMYGACTVIGIRGLLTGEDMEAILPFCKKKVLLRGGGEAYLSISAAYVLSDFNIDLIGTDGVSIATQDEEYAVHKEILMNDIVILEGLNLKGIPDGDYRLAAFPLKLTGLEASPVRAVLFEQEKGI